MTAFELRIAQQFCDGGYAALAFGYHLLGSQA